jgi:protein involved in polysaccharide export with SLBB domain
LRARFDEELAKYRRAPRTMITPVSFRSKKYVMLGKVAPKGVFVLDRPLTIIEAVARAHGLETGLFESTTVEVADLSRSFLVRQGQRVKVDFERLFQSGDLSRIFDRAQNCHR